MVSKFYVDNCIWIDYFEDRKDSLKPLGEFAFQFFKKCKSREDKIIFSSIVEEELLKFYSKEELQNRLLGVDLMIERVTVGEGTFRSARKYWVERGKIFPLQDVTHAFLAKHLGAVIITRDFHFREFNFVNSFTPEEC